MALFYVFASLLVVQGLVALLEGFNYLAYVRACLRAPLPSFTPRVALIAPCKGLDEGISDFLESLFELDYPDYQIVFALESASDSAAAEIARWQARYPHVRARAVIAGASQTRGQKVHNLLAAIATVRADADVYAFVDSDVCVPRAWLRALVAPLADERVGATTGYRWFIPANSFASVLRSVWNGSIATALGGHNRNFAWGGSMAIGRETFERIGVESYWQGTVSDDYGLTHAVKAARLRVHFVPQCLVPSYGNCTLGELLEFTTRQIIITRIYSPKLWWLLACSNILFNLVFFAGVALAVGAARAGNWLPGALTATIFLLGVWKGYLRVRAISLILDRNRQEIARHRWSYYLYGPLVALLFLYNVVASAFTNRITWRGITYELRSANETVIAREG